MNISKFFTREELVSGIEVSGDAVRLIVLEKRKVKKPQPAPQESPIATKPKSEEKPLKAKGKPKQEWEEKIEVKIAVEEGLPKGIVVGGLIKDKVALEASLKSLLKKSQVKIKYAILSIPSNPVYSKVFSFPKNIKGERLEDSMKLTIGFQLPIKPEDVYLDWESIKASTKNEIILAAAPKAVINEYLGILGGVGVTVIAVEMNASSIGRAMEGKAKDAILIKNVNSTSTQIFIIKKETPYFVRVLEKEFVPEEKIEEEIRKTSDFFDAEEGIYPEEMSLADARIMYDLYNHPAIKENNGKWLASAGAALRGLMPRAEDTLISLMPVGTEQAYEYNKALSFSSFLMNTTVSLSVFFIVMFSGSWAFILSVNQRSLEQVQNFTLAPVSPNAVSLESKSKVLNEEILIASGIVKLIPDWSDVIDEVKLRVSPGIIINSFSVGRPDGPIKFTGVAKTRNDLNIFKKSISESDMFTQFDMPLSNLGQKEDIPFTANMLLKDPQVVYKNAI